MKRISRFRHRLQLRQKKARQIFTEYYNTNRWGDKESLSGPGSRLERTITIREEMPGLVKQFNVNSILDIPCGDFNWMRLIDLDIDYIGADIVEKLIKKNQITFGNSRKTFQTLNIFEDNLPKVDLVLCRDCLVHFSNADIFRTFRNIKRSGSTYLLTTTMVKRAINRNIITGEFRPINLQKPPFNLSEPLRYLDDSYPLPSYYDKYLGLWKISDLPNK